MKSNSLIRKKIGLEPLNQMNRLSMNKSLEEVHESIDTRQKIGFHRKLFAFVGPAYLICVGYMDPGNWATDIAGGSQFGYKLIWVLVMSNLIALLLQSLSARLGIVRGLDLAQASRETYPRWVNISLYFLAEISIAACDLAEVLGMAIGLQLLFNLPLLAGVIITLFDTLLLLFLINRGMRTLEVFILGLVSIIGLSFVVELFFAKPHMGEIVQGLVPGIPTMGALYIAIGIIGATVMPHNLYLHSALVQTRKLNRDKWSLKEAIRFNFIDSTIALNMAFFVNAAILILAASTFFNSGHYNVTEIQDAHRFLEPLIGNKLAPVLFAVALIAAGQSSTITGTLAGQIVMEGYINLRVQPWIRRMITRLLAIIPAVISIVLFGEESAGKLLILSQVVLSMQLGFAVIPLIHFVSDKDKMQGLHIKPLIKWLAWLSAAIIVILNIRLVIGEISGWFTISNHPFLIGLIVFPVSAGLLGLLLYVTFRPVTPKMYQKVSHTPHYKFNSIDLFPQKKYRKIAVALDFSQVDKQIINTAINMGDMETTYYLIHIVESANAILMGNSARDFETTEDNKTLNIYANQLRLNGYDTLIQIGFGNPKKEIPRYAKEIGAEILILGSHGHGFLKDILFGTVIDSVRHQVNIPVLIVK
jgi:manganese transport protein